MRKSKQAQALCYAAATVLGMGGAAQAAVYINEPFDYTAGQPIAGQMNTTSALPETWMSAGTVGSTVHQIGTPGLSGGVQPNVGNNADLKQTDVGELNRMNLPFGIGFGPNPGATFAAGSTLYYSLLLNIPSTTGAGTASNHTNPNENNDIIVGFSNALGSQGTRPNSWNGELVFRQGSAANTFDLGIRGSTTTASTTHFTSDLNPGQTYFVVVEAQINAADTDGTNTIWVNPDPSTWGVAPGTALDTGSSNGLGSAAGTWSMQSLLVGSGIAAGAAPNDMNVDEIRVGDTWADVTTSNAPLAVPEPAALALLALGALGGLRRKRR